MIGTALIALLLGNTPVAAAPDGAAARNAKSWDVLLSEYPPRARAAGEQGTVAFKVTLDRDGYATACEVTHSSGFPPLDDETCGLILNHATFKGVEESGRRKVSAVYEGTVDWRLPGASAALAAPVAVATTAVPEKLICRRTLKTGSLTGYERVCGTKADWQRMADRNRQDWGELQGAKGSTSGH